MKKKEKQRFSFMDAMAVRKGASKSNDKITHRFRKQPMRTGVEQSQFRF